jgi:hypothetical protein
MTEEVMIKLSEVTETATVDQIKYWCKLLDIQPKIISRAAHVTIKQCEALKEMTKLISQGMKPGQAAETLTNKAVTTSPVKKLPDNPELINRIESLEKAVLLLVEENKKLCSRIQEQNETQNRKLNAIQFQLEPPQRKVKEVKPWEPPKKASPEYHPLKKLWFELFDPAQLRSSH